MTEEEKNRLYQELKQGELSKDIVVIENTHHTPFLGEEFLTQYLYMGLCLSGYLKGQYDYQDFCFKAGDICWLLPNHVLRKDEHSDDYSVLSVFVKMSYFQKLSAQGNLPRHYYPLYVTSISLEPQQFELMLNGFRMIGKLADFDCLQRDELICKMFDILAIMGDEFILQRCPVIKQTQKSHLQLFERFYSEIVQHYCESHEVAFYARLLSLTPKYFATVIKNTTGQSASQWINQYVITHTKWMLQHDHHKTIQQIANQMGFSEQASFSRFFKDNTGMTPSEYRTKM